MESLLYVKLLAARQELAHMVGELAGIPLRQFQPGHAHPGWDGRRVDVAGVDEAVAPGPVDFLGRLFFLVPDPCGEMLVVLGGDLQQGVETSRVRIEGVEDCRLLFTQAAAFPVGLAAVALPVRQDPLLAGRLDHPQLLFFVHWASVGRPSVARLLPHCWRTSVANATGLWKMSVFFQGEI